MKPRTPAYRLHKPSGLAVVTLGGHHFYLGKHGTDASRREYERLVAEWLTNGRRRPAMSGGGLTILRLTLDYLAHCEAYYRIDGVPTGEARGIANALRYVTSLYEQTPAAEFGPLALKAVRQAMIDAGLARKTINAYVSRIRGMFRWAVAGELLPVTVHTALKTVQDLAPGRSEAPDHPEVPPVPVEVYEATLPHLRPRTADLLRVIRLTGCRPGEACALRREDLDTAGDVWVWRPRRHKTAHKGKRKVMVVGPQAVAILRPYVARCGGEWLFPGRKPGRHLQEDTLWDSVDKACERAGLPHWTPNQLRHLRATEIRARWGVEAAQAVLDHERLSTTELYAERDLEAVKAIIREIG